ncbi:NADH-quinone oxidoreductase subunit C, partial [Rhizobium ruizarguesonis]
PAVWESATLELAKGRLTLLGLWGEKHAVHMALLDESAGSIAVISLEGLADGYPSVARHHPPALRLERAIRDLTGLEPQDLPDIRPWLDHGRWDLRHPLG